MIVLDTYAWIWWVHDVDKLTSTQLTAIQENEDGFIGVSAISCWEVAKLVKRNRLELPVPLEQWFTLALQYPAVGLIPISPEIAVESTRLGSDFHRDPADQLITATARVMGCPLVTSDAKIARYHRVQTVS